eukprot:9207684-Ditylum_brightwellii.AAC.1
MKTGKVQEKQLSWKGDVIRITTEDDKAAGVDADMDVKRDFDSENGSNNIESDKMKPSDYNKDKRKRMSGKYH